MTDQAGFLSGVPRYAPFRAASQQSSCADTFSGVRQTVHHRPDAASWGLAKTVSTAMFRQSRNESELQ